MPGKHTPSQAACLRRGGSQAPSVGPLLMDLSLIALNPYSRLCLCDGSVNALLPRSTINFLKAGTWMWHIVGASIKSGQETRTHAGISTEGSWYRELILWGLKLLTGLKGMGAQLRKQQEGSTSPGLEGTGRM